MSMSTDSNNDRRSRDWFGKTDKNGFIHRSWLKNQGHPHHQFDGRPVIGICNTWSELTPCNGHLRDLSEQVKRGVIEAGGFPLEFPVISLGEPVLRPTAMLYRNLLSMDVEEMIRANPLDGVVLLTGCDKTTPGTIMGAASVDIPTIVVTGGPMLNGKYEGRDVGSGTDLWKFSEEVRAGRMTCEQMVDAEACFARSSGHCMSMGTASTMACMVESLGLTLSGGAAIPAADSRRKTISHLAGSCIVEMVKDDRNLSKIVTREAMENAIMVNAAVGGSTNFIIHLLAIAGRLGIDLTLDDFDRLSRNVPLLVDVMPSGRFLMEDFFYAGGVPAVIRELLDRLHGDCLNANGKTLGENYTDAPCHNREVIRPVNNPLLQEGGSAVCKGNLAENGAVIKPSAAAPELLKHRGPAVVFENIEDYHARIDDPDLNVTADSVLVLKMVGPKGYPGMAEVGNMGLPRKLLEQGVTDMVRISDGRMSGTAFGAVFLHVSPEAADGGTLAIVKEGDMIEVDVPARRIHLDVSDEEVARRRAAWQPPAAHTERGYVSLYTQHVQGAHLGADMDYLRGGSGAKVVRDSH